MEWTGKRTSWGPEWTLMAIDDGFELRVGDRKFELRGDVLERAEVRTRFVFWREVRAAVDGRAVSLRGVSRQDAAQIARAMTESRIRAGVQPIIKWAERVQLPVLRYRGEGRWISEQMVADLESLPRPSVGPILSNWLQTYKLLGSLTDTDRAAVHLWSHDLRVWIDRVNEEIVQRELIDRRPFFDRIESSPLTEQQARAVICFDNRVNLVASAGSGKTSVMVARAAYAIERGFVPPQRILLLAFNKAAASELQERVETRLKAAGISSKGIRASTFHSFGLSTIGEAKGQKPRLASWLEGGQDIGMIMRIVDELRDRSTSFRLEWDLYRLLFANAAELEPEAESDASDGYDKATGKTGLKTYAGHVVRSQGERMIADFLFLNGIAFEYEKQYVHRTADAHHSQYRPDFYYPEAEAWHEHWAIGFDGHPPTQFAGYAESMEWKRSLHHRNGTTLVETTWADIVGGDGLDRLGEDLSRLGLTLDWNPDRKPAQGGAQPVKHQDLARLIRTFMSHVKSNSLTREALKDRVDADPRHRDNYRTRLFLRLYWQVHHEWEARLVADDAVDFEDMLVRAAELVETGAIDPAYDLVLVDEFQDASQARARLVAALVNKRDRFLLAVGDDWQAINRFAGADISVMSNFEDWFGRGQQLKLETTFRCTQEICDVSSAFVSKNPSQIPKVVHSVHGPGGDPVLVTYSRDSESLPHAIKRWLDRLVETLDEVDGFGADGIDVNVLGRYNFDKDLVPVWKHPKVRVTFRTVHSSKGLEADYIIVPNVTKGTYGFPSQIADDPVLDLAMARAEDFEHSEERRLFYVALTRARRQVVLFAVPGAESVFLAELRNDGLVEVDPAGYQPPTMCRRCGKGVMVKRNGPYGQFLGCSTFPVCRQTQDIDVSPGFPGFERGRHGLGQS